MNKVKVHKTETLKFRLTEEEKEEILKRAQKESMTLSSYIRKSVLGERIASKTDLQTVFELKKIGVNLNQLARHVNSLPVDENILESIDRIDFYMSELKKVIDKLL